MVELDIGVLLVVKVSFNPLTPVAIFKTAGNDR